MERKEKQLLKLIKVQVIGSVNLNGGKIKGLRCEAETADGLKGQIWARDQRSLEKNYPLNVVRHYDLVPKECHGKMIWKIEVTPPQNITPQDLERRREVIATNQPVSLERVAARSTQSPDPDLCSTIVCATSYLAATLLAANGKEHVDEILLRALEMKKDIEYMINGPSKEVKVAKEEEVVEVADDDIPF